MIQTLRDSMSGWIAAVIVGLLIASFAFFGVTSYFTTSIEPDAVARVNDEPITRAEFQQRYSDYRQQMLQMFGGSLDGAYFEDPIRKREFLDRMITNKLLEQVVRTQTLGAAATEIQQEIMRIPQFQVDGKFDLAVYERQLKAARLSPRLVEDDIAEGIVTRRIPQAVEQSALISDLELDLLYRAREQTRSGAFVLLPVTLITEGITVSDEEIAAEYEANSSAYLTEESVILDYLEVKQSELVKADAITDAELAAAYEREKARFVTGEQRRAAHILVNLAADANADQRAAAEARVAALQARLASGEDFAEVAKADSDDPGSKGAGGDLGWIERNGQMVKAFEDGVFAAVLNEVHGPVESEFGLHLIRVSEVRKAKERSLDEVNTELRIELARTQAEREFNDLAGRLVDLTTARSDSLSEAATELGLTIQRSEPITRLGGPGIGASHEVQQAAFSDDVLRAGLNSTGLAVDPTHYVVVRLAEHRPAVPRSLEEVREQIRFSLLQKKLSGALEARAKELQQQLAEGKALADLAAELGLEVQPYNQIKRNLTPLDPQLVAAIFDAKPEQLPTWFDAPGPAAGRALVQLDRIELGDPSALSTTERASLRTELKRGIAVAESDALLAKLRAGASIEVLSDSL